MSICPNEGLCGRRLAARSNEIVSFTQNWRAAALRGGKRLNEKVQMMITDRLQNGLRFKVGAACLR